MATPLIALFSLVLAMTCAFAQPQTTDEWFALTVKIQREIDQADFENRTFHHVNAEDRQFVQKMLNELTASENAMPTKAQARWLLSIKEWVKVR